MSSWCYLALRDFLILVLYTNAVTHSLADDDTGMLGAARFCMEMEQSVNGAAVHQCCPLWRQWPQNQPTVFQSLWRQSRHLRKAKSRVSKCPEFNVTCCGCFSGTDVKVNEEYDLSVLCSSVTDGLERLLNYLMDLFRAWALNVVVELPRLLFTVVGRKPANLPQESDDIHGIRLDKFPVQQERLPNVFPVAPDSTPDISPGDVLCTFDISDISVKCFDACWCFAYTECWECSLLWYMAGYSLEVCMHTAEGSVINLAVVWVCSTPLIVVNYLWLI